ncbi:MAG TPA: terminase family protein [Acidimicrobiales bacterium]|nr:terminase family protein [Acidimicrobiales bacterium]
MSDRPKIQPQPGPQSEFLASSADIAVYGGSAGGGKSWALLVEPLRHIMTVPGFNAVIFRRTYPEITNPGGLWDQSSELYTPLGATPRQGNLDWTFPPHGNAISFRHLQHEANKYQWQGTEVAFFGFDELSHFTESQFTYVALSRGRSTCGVRPYVRATTNPDPGWVKAFLAPWVDREFPAPARSGEVRHFVREQGKLVWVEPGHQDAKSLSFVRASIYDNRVLLTRNPEYLASLKALLPVERARLLDGDWDVRREGLVYPDFESCVVAGEPAASPDVGGIDFGFTNPFACVWGHLDHDGCLWITGCRYVRQCTLPVHAEAIPRGVRYWCDPAQPESRVELRNAGHDAVPCVHLSARGAGGEKRTPILHGIDLVSERIRTGRLKVVRNACLPLIREAGMYRYDPSKASENPVDEDNHALDSLRYLIVGLDRGRQAPSPVVAVEPSPAPAIDDDDERYWR